MALIWSAILAERLGDLAFAVFPSLADRGENVLRAGSPSIAGFPQDFSDAGLDEQEHDAVIFGHL
jgi:hypothetical protein